MFINKCFANLVNAHIAISKKYDHIKFGNKQYIITVLAFSCIQELLICYFSQQFEQNFFIQVMPTLYIEKCIFSLRSL